MAKDWLRYPRVLLLQVILAVLMFTPRRYWVGFDVLGGLIIILLVCQILVRYVFTSKTEREEARKRDEYIRKGQIGQEQVVKVRGVEYVFPSDSMYGTYLRRWAHATDEYKVHIDQESNLVMRGKDDGKLGVVPFGEVREFIMAEAERKQQGGGND